MSIISPAKLGDFEYMSTHEIGYFYGGMLRGWAKKPEQIIVTVVNRLAWLIKTMERTPNDGTAACAHWYLDHIDAHVPLPDWSPKYMDVYVERLVRSIEEHESRMGYRVSPDWFARLVGDDETRIRWVLYGPPARYTLPPSPFRLEEKLDAMIMCYCWRSTVNN